MTAYGALPIDHYGPSRAGSPRLTSRTCVAWHRLTGDGVSITLPAGGRLTDAQAKRLAWAILSDLAPDEVVPVPDVVTYKEAQRLAVLRAVGGGLCTAVDVAAALGWRSRTVQRRLAELVGDGRLAHAGQRMRGQYVMGGRYGQD